MSKELTKKWKDNKLEKGWYYILCYNDWKGSAFETISWACDGTIPLPVKEVLAPVPSYEELQKLKERVADADKTINSIILEGNYYFDCCKIAKSYLEKWGVK